MLTPATQILSAISWYGTFFAAPEFEIQAHSWCYPIIGCAQYRGYFSRKNAFDYAESLERAGLETYIGGVQAYSTLGWFDDPILNTFLDRSDTQLAALLFHELSHRLGYAKGDTEFNESFATVIEQFAVSMWLRSLPDPDSQRRYQSYLVAQKNRENFTRIVLSKRAELGELYNDKSLNDDAKRTEKNRLFKELRGELEKLDESSGKPDRYARWAENLNNAKLVPINSYRRWVPAIRHQMARVLEEKDCQTGTFLESPGACKLALTGFYSALKKLVAATADERLSTLESWQESYETDRKSVME